MIRRRPNPVLAGKDVSLDELAIRLEHGNAFCLIELPSVVGALTCELASVTAGVAIFVHHKNVTSQAYRDHFRSVLFNLKVVC